MQRQDSTLATFYASWKGYQDQIRRAVAPLTAEQLALRSAPHLRSIGENALHIVGCRMFWFTGFLGEDGGQALQAYARWNEAALGAPYASRNEFALALGSSIPSAADLAEALDRTWHFIADCLAQWSPADMLKTFRDDGFEVSRAWVVWHVLEHDLHHGGELSFTLGMHGLQAPNI